MVCYDLRKAWARSWVAKIIKQIRKDLYRLYKSDLPTWTILTYPFLAATWSGVFSYLSYSSTSVLPLRSFRRNCKVAWRKIKIQKHGNTYFLSLSYMYTDGQRRTDNELWFQAKLVHFIFHLTKKFRRRKNTNKTTAKSLGIKNM